MENKRHGEEDKQSKSERASYYPADATPRREGGDDSLAEASPTDPRNDEKVIYNNEEAENKVNRNNK